MNRQEGDNDHRVQARHNRLGLQLEPGQLRVVICPLDGDSTLHQFSIPLDPTADTSKALEDAIYATPMLLGDYDSISVTVATDNFTPVPTGLAEVSDSVCGLTDESSGQILMADQVNDSLQIIWSFDRKLYNFIERTFRNCPVRCSVTPLVRYFQRKTLRGNSGKVFAHLHGPASQIMDLFVFGADGQPRLITTKKCMTEADKVYFILAAIQISGLSRTEDEVQICGDTGGRDTLLPLLRRYVRHAVPVIFPSEAFRMGREALAAPFPLIVQNLCE